MSTIRHQVVGFASLMLMLGVPQSLAWSRYQIAQAPDPTGARVLVPTPQRSLVAPKIAGKEKAAVAKAVEQYGGKALGVAAVEGGYKVRLLLPEGRLKTVFIEQ
jgi:hypothetical protein